MTPDWLVVGAPVVEFTSYHGDRGGNIERSTVARIGKRDVVLANGSRYPVAKLSKRRGTWDPTTYLLPPDDDLVRRAEVWNRLGAKQRLVERAYNDWLRGRTLEQTETLRDAAANLVHHLKAEQAP